MLAIEAVPDTAAAEPRIKRWTRDEYHAIDDLGCFRGQRIQLVEGRILQMSPQKARHFAALDRIADALRAGLGPGHWVRTQAPLALSEDSEPEPDVSVVWGSREDYSQGHPTSAMLVIEVSDTTLRFDRSEKASLYAAHGIPEYWLLNLVDGQLERHTEPRSASGDTPARYEQVSILKAGDTVSPLFQPSLSLKMDVLLPTAPAVSDRPTPPPSAASRS